MTKHTSRPISNLNLANTSETINIPILPKHGFSRERQLLPFLPFGSSCLWDWSRKNKFVNPIKLSPTITVWSNAKVHSWLENIEKGYDPETATQLANALNNDIEGA